MNPWQDSTKIYKVLILQTGAIQLEYYHENDFRLGAALNVWGRKVVLCDCDEFTKEFYHSKYGIGTL